jgi:hypothetical protein
MGAARKKNVGCIRNSDKQRHCKWPGEQQRAEALSKGDNGPA